MQKESEAPKDRGPEPSQRAMEHEHREIQEKREAGGAEDVHPAFLGVPDAPAGFQLRVVGEEDDGAEEIAQREDA